MSEKLDSNHLEKRHVDATNLENQHLIHGILVIDKPVGKSSFAFVQAARRVFNERCIGHAGTLDPLASGLLVLLIGRTYTKQSDSFLLQDKCYQTRLHLGSSTSTYDEEGEVTNESSYIPSLAEVEDAIATFQGSISQEPPMFSAKKMGGKKLYQLARQGLHVERKPQQVEVSIKLLDYTYPFIDLEVSCSKGTYIRSLGHDIGKKLNTFAHLESLRRLKSGHFTLEKALDGNCLFDPTFSICPAMMKEWTRASV